MQAGLKRTRGRPKAFNPKPEQTTIQALDRAVEILKVLARGEGMSLSELAEASGQAPATTLSSTWTAMPAAQPSWIP